MPETPQYTVEYRKVKHPRLEYKTGTLLMILPKTGWTPEQVLEKYAGWVKRKQATIDNAVEQTAEHTIINTRTEKMLRTLVNRCVEEAQKELKTNIHKIYFREMKTKWASHSKNSNLTINTILRFLPGELISYVIYHETAHNIERRHNDTFWKLIRKRYPEYPTMEKDLLTYWFLIQKTSPTQRSKHTDCNMKNR